MTRGSLPPFQHVLDEHGPALWRFCRATLGPHDGSDWFQDTVVQALRGYRTVSHDTNLRAWLFTIAHRRRIDAARAASRRPRPSDRAVAADVITAGEADGAARVVDEELWAAVARLPDKQRQAVAYRYLADLPYAEIGQIIGCSEGAARQNVRAGLATLRTEVSR